MAKELSNTLPDKPWTRSYADILDEFDVEKKDGLNRQAVGQRRQTYGPNKLREIKRKSALEIWIDQFESLVVLLLLAAAVTAFLFGQWVDSAAIFGVVIINAAIGFFTELKAVRSMEALKELGGIEAKVRREDELQEVPAEELVPGDIVILESGDIISADLRLFEASKLQVNESALTGESTPVSKQIDPLDEDTPLAEQSNMVFKGTSVTRGSGKGVAVRTGMETELGEISALVEEAAEEVTPLEQRLNQLAQRLVWVTLAVTTVVAIVGIVSGRDILVMVETAIALAVAAIPEGLPIVATIALARGMHRMARRNALINKLAAVETLGGTNVICTDKTGTLTENQMTVICLALEPGTVEMSGEGLETEGEFTQNGNPIDPAENRVVKMALELGVLCNNASLSIQPNDQNEAVGEPIEVALLVAGAKAGWHRDELLAEMPEEREVAFDPENKMMATFNRQNGEYRMAVKGAPEAVLKNCTRILTDEGDAELTEPMRQQWLNRNEEMAESGLRVLALSTKTTESVEVEPYREMIFVGLVGMFDPPREEVRDVISECKEAGIEIVMVTGDHPITARNVGQAIGLIGKDGSQVILGSELKTLDEISAEQQQKILGTPIFARVSPRQKLNLIDIHQEHGKVVAMTGDGVNDAPALKKADIGVAMGQRGTQVAKEAAAMVLKDDSFSTIAVAVAQGRVIFNNIRKFVLYLFSGNLSEIIGVGIAALINAPLPLLPLQILFLNTVTDVFPALALGVGEGDPHVMQRPPRDSEEAVMTREHWYALVGYSFLLAVVMLGALALALIGFGMVQERAVTVSFLTLAFSKLWHVFNMRDPGSNFWNNDVTQNPFVWGALLLCTVLLLVAVYLPGLAAILKVVNPGIDGWLLAIGMSLLPWLVGQLLHAFGLIRYK